MIRTILYRTATDERQWQAGLNRYDRVIGAYVTLAGRCLSVQWRRA